MNKSNLLVVSAIFALSACSTVKPPGVAEYVDLVGHKEAVADYWAVKHKVVPEYPRMAGQNGISGCVEFSLLIGADGKPQNMTVIKSFPGEMFNKKAYEALSQWQWLPAAMNKQKQPVLTTIQLDFTTRNSVNHAKAYSACKI
ncbi:energy transducer TonB [Rheinheimera sp.]|uniref:energy transducer TonB n=1 Tax=Rheinheimera sp. TaxID=1869214 RepID=UPI002732725B|nr:energy transducer TonB [Rheinheimera sp.]MDP2714144.1 energy transducer TonB [Rheinheimera sp.]